MLHRLGKLVLVLALLSGVPHWGFAHPHAWIDVQLELVWNDQQQIVALGQQWLLDVAISAYLLGVDTIDSSQTFEDADLVANAAVRSMVQRLAPFRYFTLISYDSDQLTASHADKVQGFINEENRLGLRFEIPFDEPKDLNQQTLRFAVFDPTYYIAMLYDTSQIDLGLTDESTQNCTIVEHLPNPDPAYVAYVAALPPTQQNDSTIGEAFAIWMEITC